VLKSKALSFILEDQAEFGATEFNRLGELLQAHFPEVNIIGNYEKPQLLNGFEVYLRGVGPLHQQDEIGRIFLYNNKGTGKKGGKKVASKKYKFPFRRIYDNILDIVIAYGSISKMGAAQRKFVKKYSKVLPKKSKISHGFPFEF
jgi:hypothetical protein